MKVTSHTQSILNKKAIISFIFSKLAFLIFGIIITGAFFYFLGIQKDLQTFNENVKSAEGIINVAGTASASPFNVSVKYLTNIDGNVSVQNNTLILNSKGQEIRYTPYLQLNNSSTINAGCVNITKLGNNTVILKCQ